MAGFIGALCLSFCGFPMMLKSIKEGNSSGVSGGFLLLWFVGEVLTLYYVFNSAKLLPLLLNYSSNILFLLVIIFYKLFPRKI